MMKVICLLIVGLTLVAAAADVALPSSLKICKLNDPTRNECIKDSIQAFIPSLHKAMPELGFRAMDPYSDERISMQFKQVAGFDGSIEVKNFRFYGLARAQVRGVKSQFKGNSMELEIDMFFPRLFTEGSYKSEAAMRSGLKFASKGDYNISMTEVATVWKMKGSLVKVNGEDYMKITNFDMVPTVGDMKIAASGLFPDPDMNQIFVGFINQFWPMMYKQMLPVTRKLWGTEMINLLNNFFSIIPFRRLLL